MTVDMLTATFFWPEGTLLHVRRDVPLDVACEELPSQDRVADPPVEEIRESVWATMLRQMGWPLSPKLLRLS